MSKGKKGKTKSTGGSTLLTKEEFLLLEEYKLLNNYIARGSSTFWSRFSILFSINLFLFSVCSFLFKLSLDIDTSVNIPLQFWIYITIISLCIIIGIVVSIIWYFVTERSSALNALWNDRMRIIEKETLNVIQTQNLLFKVFTLRREEMIEDYEKSEKQNDKNGEESHAIKFNKRFSFWQKFSISTIIIHIIFTILLLWIVILMFLIIVIIFTKIDVIVNYGRLFYLLLIPTIFLFSYIAFAIYNTCKTKAKIKKQFSSEPKEPETNETK